jgi:hypothetical protein
VTTKRPGPYREALERGRKTGVSRAPAAEAIAMFCQANLQTLVGAVSPELTWTGAVARRMTFLEFGRLCARPIETEALQWLNTVVITCARKRYRLYFSALPGEVFGPYDFGEVRAQLETGALLSPVESRTLALEALEFSVSGRELPEPETGE